MKKTSTLSHIGPLLAICSVMKSRKWAILNNVGISALWIECRRRSALSLMNFSRVRMGLFAEKSGAEMKWMKETRLGNTGKAQLCGSSASSGHSYGLSRDRHCARKDDCEINGNKLLFN